LLQKLSVLMKISTFYTEKTRNRPQSSQIFNLNNEEREGRFEAKIKELEGLVAELAPLNPENQALRARVQTLLEGAAKSGKALDELKGTVSTLTVDLPAVAANEGSVFTFVNTGADGSNGMVITGAAGTEYITYKGVVNQITLTNTKATSKVGDYVKIGGAISGTTWTVLDIQGVWA